MDPRCQVCSHDSRLAIDQAILNGKSLNSIARQFGIGSHRGETFRPDHKIVGRHRDNHLGEAYAKARDADLEASGLALVNRMKQLDEDADAILARCREGEVITDGEGLPVLDPKTGQYLRRFADRTFLAAIREARRNVEMRARLAGALPEGTDEDALAKARAALNSPKARKALADLEAALAAEEAPAD
jgi:hypothetical protein